MNLYEELSTGPKLKASDELPPVVCTCVICGKTYKPGGQKKAAARKVCGNVCRRKYLSQVRSAAPGKA